MGHLAGCGSLALQERFSVRGILPAPTFLQIWAQVGLGSNATPTGIGVALRLEQALLHIEGVGGCASNLLVEAP